jgi:hypothetical protein
VTISTLVGKHPRSPGSKVPVLAGLGPFASTRVDADRHELGGRTGDHGDAAVL